MLKGSASDKDYQAALTKAKDIVDGAEIIDDTKKDEDLGLRQPHDGQGGY